jgi:hypothetical protein
MLKPPRSSGEFRTPPDVAPPEASSNGHNPDLDPDEFPINLTAAIRAGAEVEAAETARLEAELKANRLLMAGTLRAVLAERMVRAPTTEFDAVQVPEKDSLRQKREVRKAAGSRNGNGELSTAAVMRARKRLGGVARFAAEKRPAGRK